MIVKNRTIPLRIQVLETLMRRLPANHPKRPQIQNELGSRRKGFKGEESLDFYLKKLPIKNFLIFHDLRMSNGQDYFQIDTLLVCSHVAMIIESKNYSGTLLFDKDFGQVIRTSNEKDKGYPDPLAQVQRQQHELLEWLKKHNIPQLPIEYMVVITNPETIIKAPGYPEAKRRVCHSRNMLKKVNEFQKTYPNEVVTPTEIRKLKRLLVKSHTPPEINIQKSFGINPKDTLSGVQCHSCNYLPMIRKRGTWFCPKCRAFCKDAHIQALNDYFLLINSSITNHGLRQFLHISSRVTAKKLLISMNLPHSGKNKGRVYYRPED
ncbi:nuclease-related domain-containing protein [Bacillus sp. T33-2]|uniref:nuclease-related domain-containing protein n=1 Tax=Bacillus sp. T33-2 TaxID=2054168 RepID=UPI000C770D60|nr:nuclease-related domain-containing protein [Bacillus sp. T33-2]PLR91916.1 NERD nuclease [Bacillus sp. T33-2]